MLHVHSYALVSAQDAIPTGQQHLRLHGPALSQKVIGRRCTADPSIAAAAARHPFNSRVSESASYVGGYNVNESRRLSIPQTSIGRLLFLPVQGRLKDRTIARVTLPVGVESKNRNSPLSTLGTLALLYA